MSLRRADHVTRLVLAVVAGALVVRFVGLGWRVAHWDEARVAYWVLRSAETGVWEYRPIIHGPFLQHVARWLFGLLGPTDAVMRLPVAVVGGLLPLAALLVRSRLRDSETVALALVLAADPLLVYYSRFFRSDVPVAAFAFVAFAAALRAHDTGQRRYGLLAAVALGLAFTAKENAVLYLACWAGSGAVVAGWLVWRGRLALPDRHRVGRSVRRWGATVLLGVLVFLTVVVLFYAPRGTGLTAVQLVRAATVGSARKLVDLWILGGVNGGLESYPRFFTHYVTILLVTGVASLVGAAVALVVDRDRPLVVFCLCWALASLVGYPYVNDLRTPWSVVHTTVALAIPAAVGLAWLARRAVAGVQAPSPLAARPRPSWLSLSHRTVDRRRAAVLALVVLLGVHGAVATVAFSYAPMWERNVVAHGAQPVGSLAPLREDLPCLAAENDGPDVLFYGEYAVTDESANDSPPAAANWFTRLPMPWYTERAGAQVVSATDPSALTDPPPVVVVPSERRSAVEPRLSAYEVTEHGLLLRPENTTYQLGPVAIDVPGETVLIYVRPSVETAHEGVDPRCNT